MLKKAKARIAKASLAIGLIALLQFSLAVIVFFSWPDLQKCFASGDKIDITTRCVGHVAYHYRDAVNVVATVLVALFTFTLWRSTKAMMTATKETADLTRETVNLTREDVNRAREEFISTHRPRLRVRQFMLDTPTPDDPLMVSFALINIGETSANWRNVVGEVVLLLQNGRFLGLNEIAQPIDEPPIRSGERRHRTILSRFNVTAEQIDAIAKGELIICAVGELEYTDELGVPRRTGFRRNYDFGSDKFIATTDQDDEYWD
jgi:hypothetical protein